MLLKMFDFVVLISLSVIDDSKLNTVSKSSFFWKTVKICCKNVNNKNCTTTGVYYDRK